MATATNSAIPDAEFQSVISNTVLPVFCGVIVQQVLLGVILVQTCRYYYYYAHLGRGKEPKLYL